MSEAKIQPAADNQEKRDTYAKMFGRYKSAMKNEFYLEAIFIAYAVMEDRITRFLVHAGLVNDKTKLQKNHGKAAKELVKQLSPDNKSIINISTRIEMLSNLSKWTQETERKNLTSKYENALLEKMVGNVDLAELDSVLKRIPEWTKVRNECVHGLMRKNAVAAEDSIKELAEESYDIIRRLDALERSFKRGVNLRKRFNIQ